VLSKQPTVLSPITRPSFQAVIKMIVLLLCSMPPRATAGRASGTCAIQIQASSTHTTCASLRNQVPRAHTSRELHEAWLKDRALSPHRSHRTKDPSPLPDPDPVGSSHQRHRSLTQGLNPSLAGSVRLPTPSACPRRRPSSSPSPAPRRPHRSAPQALRVRHQGKGWWLESQEHRDQWTVSQGAHPKQRKQMSL
jgi:hypothetical protein